MTGVNIPDGKAVAITALTSDIAGNGSGVASETLVVDTIVPDAIAANSLSAAVLDRRQTSFHLSWPAPADGGQPVGSYAVKISKTPITQTTFDAASTIAFGGSPATPGATDGIDVANRLIETNYFFAVAALDSAGNRSPIVTVGPTAARFNLKVLGPPAGGPTNERFSASVDGVADLNGDSLSDILVGAFSGQNAYVFFGSATFGTVTSPSVTITGPASAGFGRQFIDIGDIDADGKEDFAISAPLIGNGRIYIFKGRTNWKATYAADSEADYILELDSTYAGTFFGGNMVRLGDFNGDGVDDFAVGSFGYAAGKGRVVIILGKAGFSSGSLSIQTIDGDPAFPAGAFASSILGMGRFYTVTGGNTLVVSAVTAAPNSRGRIYAFHGLPGTSAAIVATAADEILDGPVDNGQYGSNMALVGALAGAPGIAIDTGKGTTLGNGIVDVYYGSPTTGMFSVAPTRFTDSLALAATDLFGRVILGSAFPGTALSVSIIGDGKPDLMMAPFTESSGGVSRVYIIDGGRLSSIASPANVVTTADVILPLPSDWKSVANARNGTIRDLDGDGYGDFCIGENISTGAGRLAVYW